MYKIVEFSHQLIIDYLKQEKLIEPHILDATCGMGNDTLFLANLLNNKGFIDAIDIQDIAIQTTKQKTLNFSNVNVYKENHLFIDPLIYDIILFNLGYLPTVNKEITTKCSTTLEIINKICNAMLQKKIFLLVCVYPGHEEGLKESQELNKYFKNLDSKQYLVSRYDNYNQNNSPYLFCVKKKGN